MSGVVLQQCNLSRNVSFICFIIEKVRTCDLPYTLVIALTPTLVYSVYIHWVWDETRRVGTVAQQTSLCPSNSQLSQSLWFQPALICKLEYHYMQCSRHYKVLTTSYYHLITSVAPLTTPYHLITSVAPRTTPAI